jgi:hypothetical protein
MRKLVVVVLGILFAGVLAGQAFAANGTGGYIELCKAPNAALTGSAQFTIADAVGTSTVAVAVGTCTQPLPVAPGSVTVTEDGALTGLTSTGTISTTPTTAFVSATTTAVGPTGPLAPGVGFVYTANVPASPNGSTNTVTVTYTDTLVTGVVEVCKQVVTGSGLTGTFQFTVTGGNGFTSTVSVPAGDCSSPITVPAGLVMVRETGDLSESVTAITATQTAAATNAIVGPNAGPAADLPTGTVVASVVAGDASRQTLVTFTNNSVRLKLCKYVDGGLTNTTAPGNSRFPFTFSAVGNAGPNGTIAPLTLAAGNSFATAVCTVVGTFRAGLTVTITEGITPGTKVGSIVTSPTINTGGTATVVPGSLSLPNRTISVVLGAGETVVTYEDVPALPGMLKICKVAGVSTPPVVAGTLFTFTITNGAVVRTLTVPAGSCAIDGNYPFDTTVSVAEAAVTNTFVQSITAVPTTVSVLQGGVATATNQSVLTNVNLAARSASVTIGENNTTEVTYVNIDPLPTTTEYTGSTGGTTSSTGGTTSSTAGTTSTTSSTGGSSSSAATSSSGGSSSGSSIAATSVPTTAATAAPTTLGTGLALAGSTSTSTSKAAASKAALLKAVKLSADRKQLTLLKAKVKTLSKKLGAAKTPAAKHTLKKQIAALKLSEAKLLTQIKLLK